MIFIIISFCGVLNCCSVSHSGPPKSCVNHMAALLGVILKVLDLVKEGWKPSVDPVVLLSSATSTPLPRVSIIHAVRGYSHSFRIPCDMCAVSLLESREQHYIKAMNNK